MKAKNLILFLLLSSSNILLSCLTGGGDCEPVPEFFQIKGISTDNYKFKNEGLERWEMIENNSVIPWDSLFVRFSLKTEYISMSRPNYYPGGLLALSCVDPGHGGDKIGIDTLYFISLNDYNSNYSSNDTINDIIELYNWRYNQSNLNDSSSVPTYVESNKSGIKNTAFVINLSEEPSNTKTPFAVKLIYKMNNGEVFKTSSSEIILTK
jgi:hypothetical protein